MPFATYEDVARRLGRDLSASQQEAATDAIAEAEAAIVAYTGQKFVPGAYTERVTPSSGRHTLSQRPVTSITGYRIAGSAALVSALTLTGSTISGLPVGVPVEVDYQAGYSVVPDAVKGVAVRTAIALMSNPRSLTQVSIGGYSEGYRPGTGVLSPDDKALLNGYRLTGGTVFLR